MGNENALPIAQLAVNAFLALATIYVLVNHGKSGLFGWLYLLTLCVLQVTGNALFLSNPSSHGGTIIANICLSPLLLAILGILHEVGAYRDPKLDRRVRNIFTLALHILIAAAIGLVAVGASDLENPNPKASSQLLVKIGVVTLLVSWVIIFLRALSACRPLHDGVRTNKDRTVEVRQYQRGTKLLYAVLLSLLITAIRVVYTLVTVFNQSGSLNPLSRSLALEVCLSALPEMLVVVLLLGVGLQLLRIRGGE